MPRGSCYPPLWRTGEDTQVVPASRGSPLSTVPTGSETTPPYAPRSSGFGSEPPSVEGDVDVWRYAIVSCTPEMTYGLAESVGTGMDLPAWTTWHRTDIGADKVKT